jgi:group I intron endonuclease
MSGNIPNSWFRLMGTYQIICIANGRSYVGSSKSIARRLKHHLTALRAGRHPAKLMQQDFNQCGEESFEFSILEEISSDELREDSKLLAKSEWYWTDKLQPEYGGYKHENPFLLTHESRQVVVYAANEREAESKALYEKYTRKWQGNPIVSEIAPGTWLCRYHWYRKPRRPQNP